MTRDVSERVSRYDRRAQTFPDRCVGRVCCDVIYCDYVFAREVFDPFYDLVWAVRAHAPRRTW